FWTSVDVKKVNDVIRLQALVNKKKVVITEASIRDTLSLDDAEGVECLPNEEIFTELARMGYEKPSTKFTFYKVVKVHDKGVPAAGIVVEGVISAADDVVPATVEEPSIPSPTSPTPPPQLSHDISSTSQVQPTPPQSPQVQPQSPQPQLQPSQDAGGIIENINADEDVVLEVAKEVVVEKSVDINKSDDIQGRTAESQAKIYKIDLDHAKKVLSMQEEESEPD
nr:hypothetical protein [Tanacetum cinerariifolium]